MNVIDSKKLERDVLFADQPRSQRKNSCVEHPAFRWTHLKAGKMLKIQMYRASLLAQNRAHFYV
jgi:hypothetical protein